MRQCLISKYPPIAAQTINLGKDEGPELTGSYNSHLVMAFNNRNLVALYNRHQEPVLCCAYIDLADNERPDLIWKSLQKCFTAHTTLYELLYLVADLKLKALRKIDIIQDSIMRMALTHIKALEKPAPWPKPLLSDNMPLLLGHIIVRKRGSRGVRVSQNSVVTPIF